MKTWAIAIGGILAGWLLGSLYVFLLDIAGNYVGDEPPAVKFVGTTTIIAAAIAGGIVAIRRHHLRTR
jgi:CDP-diglyceride synthetase